MNRKEELVRELQQNEYILQVVALEELRQELELLKDGAKLAASYYSPVMDARTAGQLIREFGIQTDRVVIKQYAGKEYVIFRGNPRTRSILKGTRYLASNPTVVRMAVGPKGIVSSVKRGFAITVLLSVGVEVFDYLFRDTSTLSQLLGAVTSDLIKIGISAIVGAFAGLVVGTVAIVGSVAGAPIIAAIAMGIVTGVVLEKIDGKVGATRGLIQAYENMGIKLEAIKKEAQRNLNYLERNPHLIPCLFGPCTGIRGY